jgi:integrase
MNLIDAVAQYAVDKDVRPRTLSGYREAVRSFDRFLGRHSTPSELEPPTVNRWLHSMRTGQSVGPYTIASRRRNILVIARYLHRQGALPRRIESHEITTIRCPPTARDIWTPDDVRKLIDAVEQLPDVPIYGVRIRARAWWRSMLRTAWESGLRWSDLSRLRRSDIGSDGWVDIVQRKTSIEHGFRLSGATIEAIDNSFCGPGLDSRELIWPVPYDRWRFDEFRRLLKIAGLTGNMQKLRRSSIADVERKQRGAGMIQAGHTTEGTTLRWYLRRTELLADKPSPSDLWEQEMDEGTKPQPKRDVAAAVVHKIKPGELVELETPKGERTWLRVQRDDRGRLSLAMLTPPGSARFALRRVD